MGNSMPGEKEQAALNERALSVAYENLRQERRNVAALREGIQGALSHVHNKAAMILHLENALRSIQEVQPGAGCPESLSDVTRVNDDRSRPGSTPPQDKCACGNTWRFHEERESGICAVCVSKGGKIAPVAPSQTAEQAAKLYANNLPVSWDDKTLDACEEAFEDGAKWQEKQVAPAATPLAEHHPVEDPSAAFERWCLEYFGKRPADVRLNPDRGPFIMGDIIAAFLWALKARPAFKGRTAEEWEGMFRFTMETLEKATARAEAAESAARAIQTKGSKE